MIRIEHRPLPDGLSAVAQRGAHGDLTIIVSASLDAGHQRVAVRAALRAARRHDWQLGLVPIPAVVVLSGAGALLRRLGHVLRARQLGHVLRAHAVASISTAVAGLAAATFLVYAIPAQHGPVTAAPGGPPAQQSSPAQPGSHPQPGGRSRPGPSGRAGATGPGVISVISPTGHSRPAPSPGTQPSPTAEPSPTPSASSSGPAPPPTQPPGPTPSSSSSSASSAPSPTPTPSSSSTSGGGGGVCVRVLGVEVCV
jgi:hypothetical protein